MTKPAPNPDAEKLPAYHHSVFSWDHSVTAQTLGVGDTPQSANPTYSMGFVAKTRYYFLDDSVRGRHFSLRLDGGLYREFTNSDSTTKRGEWDFSDTNLAAAYLHRVRGPSSTDSSAIELRPLTLVLPTAKASYESGRYFAPGVLVGVTNVSPILQGRVEPEISSLIRFAVGYERWFARATVPTNTSLSRVRLTPDGRTLPGDALSGSSLVRDQIEASLRIRFDFGKRVYWLNDFAAAGAWKYNVQNNVQVCGVVLTGCADVKVAEDESRYMVATAFNTEISVAIAKGFSVEVGYGNAALQIGADGRRRGFFYSPDAIFFTSLSFLPHELASPPKQTAAREPSSLTF